MYRYLLVLFACFAPWTFSYAQTTDLRAAFASPPPNTRPGCYWYWINDNISKEGITKDLEAMARVGIGRAYIGHIYNHTQPDDTPPGNVKFMSDAWWDALQWAVLEADRCGVEIGFFNSPGWSQSGGPWIKPSQSMRYLAASETPVTGGKRLELQLPVPAIHTFPEKGGSKPIRMGPDFTEKDFQDVRVIAFPKPAVSPIDKRGLKVSSPQLQNAQGLLDENPSTTASVGKEPTVITISRPTAESIQSLQLDLADGKFTLTCTVETSTDGQRFEPCTTHTEQRGHQGPRRADPLLIAIPPTTAPHLRITLSAGFGTPVIKELHLSGRAVLTHYVRKQLGETSPATTPKWQTYTWQPQAEPAAGTIDPKQIVDLSDKVDAQGVLRWEAPAGEWIVMRSGMVPIGTGCHPSSPESQGLEVDKMNKQHVRSLFEGMVGEFLRRTPASNRKAFKYVIADSYETGPQNWTDGFIDKFTTRFGYSPGPYLPCIHGHVVGTPVLSNRFLWDWRRLIAESIAQDYVGGLRELCHENKLTLWLENYGHWGFPSEFLLYGSMSDQVGGEFWENASIEGNIECRAAASCSHTYGRTDVYVEGFTSVRSFAQAPVDLKSINDWVFASGVNHHILHVYIHQPDERKPGIIQWFGTAFNRHNTWFEGSKAFIDYLRRSAVLLKHGRPVIDVAYHIGQSAPVMTGPIDPAIPDGYDYDHINADALIRNAKVVDGRITIENGPSYAVLVLPKQDTMTPEVAAAIRKLVEDGATVLGPKPTQSPSLSGYPDCDRLVNEVTDALWKGSDKTGAQPVRFGKGRVFATGDVQAILAAVGRQPDLTVDKQLLCAAAGAGKIGRGDRGGIVFKHRSSSEREIYFLSNTTDNPADFTASFRVSGRKPWLWNAVSGTITQAAAFTQRDGRTLVPLHLDATESVFVVFEEPIATDAGGSQAGNSPELVPSLAINGPWTVRFDGQGAPAETVFSTLSDWVKHPDETIRHYSGAAVYETKFSFDAAGSKTRRVFLDLGQTAIMATVTLNGREVGTLWCQPWRIEIGGFVKKGENTLQVRVVNAWHNRLLADSTKPEDKRLSYVSQAYRPKINTPLASGLLGPVRVMLDHESPKPNK